MFSRNFAHLSSFPRLDSSLFLSIPLCVTMYTKQWTWKDVKTCINQFLFKQLCFEDASKERVLTPERILHALGLFLCLNLKIMVWVQKYVPHFKLWHGRALWFSFPCFQHQSQGAGYHFLPGTERRQLMPLKIALARFYREAGTRW